MEQKLAPSTDVIGFADKICRLVLHDYVGRGTNEIHVYNLELAAKFEQTGLLPLSMEYLYKVGAVRDCGSCYDENAHLFNVARIEGHLRNTRPRFEPRKYATMPSEYTVADRRIPVLARKI